MYTIKISSSFDSAHFLSGYSGYCANIHGHRWKVEIEICSQELLTEESNRGMVVDFSVAKKILNEIINEYDHGLIVEKGSLKEDTYNCLVRDNFRVILVDYRPTAENIAKYIYQFLSKHSFKVRSVTVYETPNNSATFEESE